MAHNLNYWCELAEIHSRGDYYPVDAVIKGVSTLRAVELELLGEPAGRRMVHTHCHIGLDTISLARFGFFVTGMDYSPTAIQHARQIAAQAGIRGCDFVVADSSALADPALKEVFDIYYASYGVLVWVPDIAIWFKCASSYLRPGGELVLIDEHPYAATFEGGTVSEYPPVAAPYWQKDGPYTTRNAKSYSGDSDVITNDVQIKWPHSLGEIISAASEAGLQLIELREYPYSHYQSVPEMVVGNDLYYHHPRWSKSIPFLFSLKLTKEERDDTIHIGV